MNAIELFAGAGGLGIGIGRAGFTPSRIIERDGNCQTTLLTNRRARLISTKGWPSKIEGDVCQVSYAGNTGIDLVSGGPPCQPFSVGGRHRAQADGRDMFPEAVRAVREVQPKAFIFENVRGLTRERFSSYYEYVKLQMQFPELVARDGEDWSRHLARLEKHHTGRRADRGLEYRLVAQVLNAADYGVPQKRYRVFFVGFRSDLNIEWSFPEPTHSQEALQLDLMRGDYFERHKVSKRERTLVLNRQRKRKIDDGLDEVQLKPWRTVRDALRTLPDPEREKRASAQFHNHVLQPGARSYKGHTGSPWDEPAKTLKAGVHGVPGGENMLAREDGTVRYFTVRESARLQTFPDCYRITGVWSEAMRQLGNAVPVTLAETVARDVACALKQRN